MQRRTPFESVGDRKERGRCPRLGLQTLRPAIGNKWIWSRPLACHAAQPAVQLSIKTQGAGAQAAHALYLSLVDGAAAPTATTAVTLFSERVWLNAGRSSSISFV